MIEATDMGMVRYRLIFITDMLHKIQQILFFKKPMFCDLMCEEKRKKGSNK